jgi:hypothetical protein
MSFTHKKTIATTLAMLLTLSCFFFIEEEDTHASADTPDVVVIYSTIDGNDSLPEIITEQENVYAEKEHYESIGSKVVLIGNDEFHSSEMSDQDKEFINDMLQFMEYDVVKTPNSVTKGVNSPCECYSHVMTDVCSTTNIITNDTNNHLNDDQEDVDTSNLSADLNIIEIVVDETYESSIALSENTEEFKNFITKEIATYFGTSCTSELLDLIEKYSDSTVIAELSNVTPNSKEDEDVNKDTNNTETEPSQVEDNDDEEQKNVFSTLPWDMTETLVISYPAIQNTGYSVHYSISTAGIEF